LSASTRPHSTPDERANAVRLYEEVGPSEAARRLGRSKSTIVAWASAQGAHTRSSEQIQEMVRQREARRQLSMAEWREEMTSQLRMNSMIAAKLEERHLKRTGRFAPSLERVTAARVKSVSDLLLLSGEATSRSASLQEIPAAAANAARLRDELSARRAAKEGQ
jgi:hypothetical protein